MEIVDQCRGLIATAFLTVAIFLPGPVHATDRDARTVIEDFVARQVAHNRIPDGGQRKIEALLSAELQCLLRSTELANKESIRQAPEEKPPFVDGNMFLPNIWEVPEKARILDMQGDEKKKVFAVEFSYGRESAPDIGHYEMRRSARGWRVADLLYKDPDPTNRYQSLTALLYGRLRAYPKAGALKCKV